jgi:hypothetical protein
MAAFMSSWSVAKILFDIMGGLDFMTEGLVFSTVLIIVRQLSSSSALMASPTWRLRLSLYAKKSFEYRERRSSGTN